MITVDTKATRASLKQFIKNLEKTIIGAHQEGGKILESEIKKDFPINSSRAVKKVTTELIQNKDGKIITSVGASNVFYTYWIEVGREPGKKKMPNFTAISKWLARRKDIQNNLQKKFFPNKKIKNILVRDDYRNLLSRQKSMVFI